MQWIFFQLKQTLVTFLFNFAFLPLSLAYGLLNSRSRFELLKIFFSVYYYVGFMRVCDVAKTQKQTTVRENCWGIFIVTYCHIFVLFFFSIFLPLSSTRRFGTALLPTLLVACIVWLVYESVICCYMLSPMAAYWNPQKIHILWAFMSKYTIFIFCAWCHRRFCKTKTGAHTKTQKLLQRAETESLRGDRGKGN